MSSRNSFFPFILSISPPIQPRSIIELSQLHEKSFMINKIYVSNIKYFIYIEKHSCKTKIKNVNDNNRVVTF